MASSNLSLKLCIEAKNSREQYFFGGNFFSRGYVTCDEGQRKAGKEVREMKTMKTILSVLFLAGAMGSSIASTARAEGVISKDALAEGSYCHMKFPAIEERTLSWKRPVLKDASEGDIIDFYGPCDHDPLGREEIQSQKRDHQRRFEREYGS